MQILRNAALSLLISCSAQANADEGMWTFDNLPREQMKSKYGFAAESGWVDHVMRAAVNIGGCSASFVSPQGLVMTNHHCITGCLQQISSAKKNYLQDGFLARKMDEELQCPTTEVSRLEQITDVTAEVTTATKGLSGEAYKNALNGINAKIAATCVGDKRATVRCTVVSLYQGGQYHLYRYDRYSDVHLVWAPEDASPSFGGDPDNFNFPRFGLDAAMLRAYENGKPAVVKHFFPFSPSGAKAGELVFTAGNPGRTSRLLTVAQLETVRDVRMIANMRRGYELRGVLTQYRKLGVEQARVARNDLNGLENGLKVFTGQLAALQSPELMNRKRDEEARLKAFAAANAQWNKETRGAWDAIAAAQAVYREIENEYEHIEGGRGFNTRYFALARTLWRGSQERTKPEAERLPEFSATRLPQVERQITSPAPFHPEFEKLKLAHSLTKMRELLGTDDPFVVRVLGKESPEQVASRLVDGTKLGDPMYRKALWSGERAAVEKADDTFIQLVRDIDGAALAVRKRFDNEVSAVEQKNAELIAKVRFAMSGSKTYPDATGTLRLSYGAVQGWTALGKQVLPFTDFAGAFNRHTGAAPYALPASWLAAKDKVQLAQTLNFVTTNDIIGGNSGSPMINSKAEVVGLAFDGNKHTHSGAYWFDEKQNRTVGVTSNGILEALKNIYGATELLAEIGGKK
ncbi:MAG: S46 family peptidase [Aeromicrobium sp.]|nr:S46 family peptidase [Burkholderiales bacterium]